MPNKTLVGTTTTKFFGNNWLQPKFW